MNLCAIFCVWNDWDWLTISYERIRPLVDGVIVVTSLKSNYGEISIIPHPWNLPTDAYAYMYYADDNLHIYQRDPVFHQALHSETDKRNFGLQQARELGYTHFVMMDADELYVPEEFKAAKKLFEDTELQGLVCRSQVYFGSPKLTIGLDTTLVPFIHKITPTLKHEFNRNYPFAWEGKSIRIDPTRSLNINSGVKMCDVTMHHYSWVRKDYEKKIRNSTARANLDRSTIREDLRLAKDGYFVKFYGKSLVRAQVEFNIPEFNVSDT
jgi:hypothetical protein